MRTADHSHVKDAPLIGMTVDELHFCYTLLTRLKADDLIDEDSRRDALDFLYRRWLLAREVTSKQSSVSQGDKTEQ